MLLQQGDKGKQPHANIFPKPYNMRSQSSSPHSLKSGKSGRLIKHLPRKIPSRGTPRVKRRKNIRRVSVKKAEALREYYNKRAIFMANIEACMCCKSALPVEIHHKRGRAGDLLTDIRHWMALCRKCHKAIHSNIARAREAGYICEKGLWNKPDRS